MTAVVNRILPFSSVDGPGNRTVIFLQGCNIDCKYCHNPESRHLCTGCGSCVKACPAGALHQDEAHHILYNPEQCAGCDTCIHTCAIGSDPRTRVMTAEEVYAAIGRSRPFIRGITMSGGECMLYPAFLTELFTLARADGLGTLIDSNGTIPFRGQEDLLSVSDGVMLDIKAYGEADHIHVTGSTNKVVLENAAYLAEMGKLYEVRCVICPDLYDGERSVTRVAEYLAPYLPEHDIRIKVIAYRPNGVRPQYQAMTVPSQEYLAHLAEIFTGHGYEHVVII